MRFSFVCLFLGAALAAGAQDLGPGARTFEPRSWTQVEAFGLYQAGNFVYVALRASTPGFVFLLTDPPQGQWLLTRGRLPADRRQLVFRVPKAVVARIDRLQVWLYPDFRARDEDKTGVEVGSEGLVIDQLPPLPAPLEAQLFDPWTSPAPAAAFSFLKSRDHALRPMVARADETPEAFLARHPWMSPASRVVVDPAWDPTDLFSPRFSVQDALPATLRPNPAWVGVWTFAYFGETAGVVGDEVSGYGYRVEAPSGPLDLAWLRAHTVIPVRPNTNKDVTWRAIALRSDGTMEVDVGTRIQGLRRDPVFPGDHWTDGYVVNTHLKTLAPLWVTQEGADEFLWMVIRNGDYDAGVPPQWLVFRRPK